MSGRTGLGDSLSNLSGRRKLLLLGLFWSSCLLLLVSYGTVSGRLHGDTVHAAVDRWTPAANETGGFSAWRHAARGNSEATYRIVFDNLSATNGALGVFRTASQKRVQIENLHVAFIAEPSASASQMGCEVNLRDFCRLFAPRAGRCAGEGRLGVFDEFGADESAWSAGVDLSNATEVRIKNLDWRVCAGDVTTLRVESRYASLRADATSVVLRGRVTITTPQAVLESNCIEMDVQNNGFVSDGRYVLTRGDQSERGQWGRFDTALTTLSTASLNSKENATWADGSLPGSF